MDKNKKRVPYMSNLLGRITLYFVLVDIPIVKTGHENESSLIIDIDSSNYRLRWEF